MIFNLRLLIIGIISVISSIQCHEQKKGNNDSHHHQQHHQTNRNLPTSNIVRCGTDEVSPEIASITGRIAKNWETRKVNDGWKGEKLANNVNVYFHIIKDSSGAGALTETDLTNSLDLLDSSFQDFDFTQMSVTTTVDDAWFTSGLGDEIANNMKQTLRKGDAKDLNVYFLKPQYYFGTLLGYATFPWDYASNPTEDGVVINYQTVPNGPLVPYDEGDTLVHEVGHWFGLLHTFQGGCSGDGDYVADTPQQAEPTSGCPTSKNSCPTFPGSDPINNFMDYSSDVCLNSFTAGQDIRSEAMWECYRQQIPGACDSSLTEPPPVDEYEYETSNFYCFSSSATTMVKGKGETSMDKINLGDEVLTALGSYETVYSIDHRSTTKLGNFIQIFYSLPMSTTEDESSNNEEQQENKPFEITSKHMVFLAGNNNPIPADNIKIGDQIQTLNGPGTVTKLSTITKKGLYNFLTRNGSIVVNGIFSSTYSAKFSNNEYIDVAAGGGYMKLISHQEFFNVLLKPYRHICTTSILLKLCQPKTRNGNDERALISKFVSSMHKCLLKQKKVYQVFSLSCLVLFVQAMNFIFVYLYNTITMLALLLLVTTVIRRNKREAYFLTKIEINRMMNKTKNQEERFESI